MKPETNSLKFDINTISLLEIGYKTNDMNDFDSEMGN